MEKKLKADWSPEQISGHLRLHGELSISHETIYIHVWRDKEAGGHLYRHLRCSPKLRRKRHNSYDSRAPALILNLSASIRNAPADAGLEFVRVFGHDDAFT